MEKIKGRNLKRKKKGDYKIMITNLFPGAGRAASTGVESGGRGH